MQDKNLKIAFVVSELATFGSFIIDQVANLLDKGVEVEVYSLRSGDSTNVTDRFYKYNMNKLIHNMEMPRNLVIRFFAAFPKFIHILIRQPNLVLKIFNVKKYGSNAYSLKLLFWVEPWLGMETKFDLIHCHYGPTANKFLIIKEILGLKQKIITTFYGYDVSHIFQQKGDKYYDKLKQECDLFLVMSENMKGRAVEHGFNPDNIKVLPISIDVESYPFQERKLNRGEEIQLMSVGRFVEKKGFDDLLRALAIVKDKTAGKFKCTIVGDGVLKDEIYKLTDNLKLTNLVDFKGYMKLEDVIKQFLQAHIYIQPSKTAKDGDME